MQTRFKPLVSVYCLCYNHSKYIRQTLDSFLTQKTSFDVEFIVHDDASTDDPASIIREYAQKHPSIIPIFQKGNQYSKKVPIFKEFIWPVVRGKYIALCEGDDYWVSPDKLQRQAEYLASHLDCTLCFHNAHVVGPDGQRIRPFFPVRPVLAKYYKDLTCDYSGSEMILLDFAPTNSLMFRACDVPGRPAYFDNGVSGDLPMRLYHASLGYAHYMQDVYSAYRVGVSGSANDRARKNVKSLKSVLDTHIWILDEFNRSTRYVYDAEVEEAKKIKRFFFLADTGSRDVFSKSNRNYIACYSAGERAIMTIKAYTPALFTLMKWLQKKYRGY